MIALVWFMWAALASPFKSKGQLAAENIALHHQVMVLWRQARGRIRLTNLDRLSLVQLLSLVCAGRATGNREAHQYVRI